ncbi:transcriptional regulator [Streptomyces sp. CS090A]|uniref:transcriptional regulator n=1 Tax=Streptomyces sp. CS090A TaxID=2162710 RepID=UPI001EF6A077|nr:transcriptional regulator [Streptomyces sp. CS090A]
MSVDLDERHPLAQVLTLRGWTGESYLRRVAERHQALGYGTLAARKEKISRWTRSHQPQTPSLHTRLAMADVLGVDAREVLTRPWPHWLMLALQDETTIWESPWTPAGIIHALDHAGGPPVDLDRRGFLITTTATLTATLAHWSTATPAPARTTGGRRISATVAEHIERRLAHLRHLDDALGSDHVYDSARAETQLVRRLLTDRTYSAATGQRLHACAAEASRLAGWCAYDQGRTGAAEEHFATALRAAAGAGDPTSAAIALAFWANLRYTQPTPDPLGALDLIDGALTHRTTITSPRVLTLLHLRRARAHSIARDPAAAYRAIDDALTAYVHGTPPEHDVPSLYWITAGEVLQAAGSAALTLNDPHRALVYFQAAATHPDPYDPHKEPRGTAIYLTRTATAHLSRGDVDGAVETARRALDLMAGVGSARGNDSLSVLRTQLSRHRSAPVVRDFLAETEQ